MPKPIRVRVTRNLTAPAPRAYDVLADYRVGHCLILPARVFTHLAVEEGGRGEGTVIRFGMRAFGKETETRALISEPEPGSVLVERDTGGSDLVTTFTVEPRAGDTAAVTIDTRWTPRGAGALFERLLAPPFLRRLYIEELENLEKVAAGRL